MRRISSPTLQPAARARNLQPGVERSKRHFYFLLLFAWSGRTALQRSGTGSREGLCHFSLGKRHPNDRGTRSDCPTAWLWGPLHPEAPLPRAGRGPCAGCPLPRACPVPSVPRKDRRLSALQPHFPDLLSNPSCFPAAAAACPCLRHFPSLAPSSPQGRSPQHGERPRCSLLHQHRPPNPKPLPVGAKRSPPGCPFPHPSSSVHPPPAQLCGFAASLSQHIPFLPSPWDGDRSQPPPKLWPCCPSREAALDKALAGLALLSSKDKLPRRCWQRGVWGPPGLPHCHPLPRAGHPLTAASPQLLSGWSILPLNYFKGLKGIYTSPRIFPWSRPRINVCIPRLGKQGPRNSCPWGQ